MKNTKMVSTSQIQRFLIFLNNLSEEDIQKLENGDVSIRFEIIENHKRTKNSHTQQLIFNHSLDYGAVINEMLTLTNRPEGEKYLQEKFVSKEEYIGLAKKLDLPFSKKDSVEKLKDKIIEATIGYRIRSQAINEGVNNLEKKNSDN
jgi:hypothetical protein